MCAEEMEIFAWAHYQTNTRELAVMVLNVSLITTHTIALLSQKDAKNVRIEFLKT